MKWHNKIKTKPKRCGPTVTVTVHHSNTSLSTPPASRPADGRRLHHPPQDVHHWGPQQTLRDVCLLRCSLNACTQYAHQYGPRFMYQPTTTAMTKIPQWSLGIPASQNRKLVFCRCLKVISDLMSCWCPHAPTEARPGCLLLSHTAE